MSTNPFQTAPLPIPLTGWNLQAPEVFRPDALARHLDRNQDWLQARPRSSNRIDTSLFPSYALGGMEREEVRASLNAALWDAGYRPSDHSDNPTWSWDAGE